MTVSEETLAELEACAALYEARALRIRILVADLRATEASLAEPSAGEAIPISEAIRRVLGAAKAPLRPPAIWVAIQQARIVLRTRSAEPRNLVDSALANMERSGQAKRVDGGWVLI